jgi:hypothetical protein
MSHRNERTSLGIDELARRFDAGQNEEVRDGVALHQIHGTAERAP